MYKSSIEIKIKKNMRRPWKLTKLLNSWKVQLRLLKRRIHLCVKNERHAWLLLLRVRLWEEAKDETRQLFFPGTKCIVEGNAHESTYRWDCGEARGSPSRYEEGPLTELWLHATECELCVLSGV
jgi:hypothetical protein